MLAQHCNRTGVEHKSTPRLAFGKVVIPAQYSPGLRVDVDEPVFARPFTAYTEFPCGLEFVSVWKPDLLWLAREHMAAMLRQRVMRFQERRLFTDPDYKFPGQQFGG